MSFGGFHEMWNPVKVYITLKKKVHEGLERKMQYFMGVYFTLA